MTCTVRVLYRGDPDVRTALSERFPDRIAFVSAGARDTNASRAVDCILNVGSLPDDLVVDGGSTVVITDDSATTRAARLAGARVLSRAVLDEPEVLFAQLDAARRSGEDRLIGESSEKTETSRTLERLLEATDDLMAADDDAAVCQAVVSAADDVLGLEYSGICLATDAVRLDPVAYTEPVEHALGTVPTLDENSLAWEVYESGEDRVYEHLDREDGLHNPETHLRSEMIIALGPYGVFLAGSEESAAFDDADVYFAKLLATTAESALDRVTKRDELERKNAQLEEFVAVVSHDLRNPLTVASGSLALARETGEMALLNDVRASHERMTEIIDGLLVLAREGNAVGEIRPVIVGTVAEEAWSTVDTGDGTLRVGDNGAIDADRSRLRQLLENAFRNSVEHGTSGLETADTDVTVTVAVTADGFRIDDDGPGIPPEERETLLAAEFGAENGGFGIPIIRTIAEGHGWELALDESDSGGLRIGITTDPEGTD